MADDAFVPEQSTDITLGEVRYPLKIEIAAEKGSVTNENYSYYFVSPTPFTCRPLLLVAAHAKGDEAAEQPRGATVADEDDGGEPSSDELQLPDVSEGLQALARARGENAKTYLVEQAGIAPGRLFSCRPEHSDDMEGKPRVEISL